MHYVTSQRSGLSCKCERRSDCGAILFEGLSQVVMGLRVSSDLRIPWLSDLEAAEAISLNVIRISAVW